MHIVTHSQLVYRRHRGDQTVRRGLGLFLVRQEVLTDARASG